MARHFGDVVNKVRRAEHRALVKGRATGILLHLGGLALYPDGLLACPATHPKDHLGVWQDHGLVRLGPAIRYLPWADA